MGIKDNFSQAMKELINPGSKEQAQPEVKDVGAYMNTAEIEQPAEAVQQSNAPIQETTQQPVEAQNSQNNTQQSPFNAGMQGNAQNTQQYTNTQNAQQYTNTQNAQQYTNNTQNTQQYNGNAVPNNNNNNNNNNNGNQNNSRYTTTHTGGYSSTFVSPSAIASDAESTIISKNTIIDGNIRSFADMKIDGNIKGNVETTKNITVNGKIIGNITCDNAVMKSSSIQGNVLLKGQATMASDSMLIGDLTSQVASVNGKVKGNIIVTGKAQLDREAVVFGDIKAGGISISDGAIIQGYISTTYLSNEERSNIFPESIALGE